jgi:hypothetical protein
MKSKEGEQYYVSHIIDWFSERLEIFTELMEKILYLMVNFIFIMNDSFHIRSAVTKPNLSTPSVTYEIYCCRKLF